MTKINQTLLAALVTNLEGGVVADPEALQAVIENYGTVVDGNDTAFNAHLAENAIDAHGTIPACRVYNSTSQSIPSGVNTAIAFNTERFDTGNFHDNITNNTRFVIPESGIYHMVGGVVYAGNATGRREISMRVNGTTTIANVTAINLSTTNPVLNLSTMHSFLAGDYVELMTYQDSGGALNISALIDYAPYFAIVRVG